VGELTEEPYRLWIRAWGEWFPQWMGRFSHFLERAFLRTPHWILWPRIEAFGGPVLFMAGFFIGASHLGFQDVVTESLPILMIACFLSFLFTPWGTVLWISFAMGDFLFYRMNWVELNVGILTPILYYSLLGSWLVQCPALLDTFPRARHSFLGLLITRTAVGASLTFLWLQAAPVLLRPLWTWFGEEPYVEAIWPLQQEKILLILATLLSIILHTLLEKWNQEKYPVEFSAVLTMRSALISHQQGRLRKLSKWLELVFESAFVTFLLAGLFSNWSEAGTAFGLFYVASCWRAGLFYRLPDSWLLWIESFPLGWRFLVAVGLAVLLGGGITILLWSSTSFIPIAFATFVSIVVIYSLLPGYPPQSQQVHAR
jgi:hypothetical protein